MFILLMLDSFLIIAQDVEGEQALIKRGIVELGSGFAISSKGYSLGGEDEYKNLRLTPEVGYAVSNSLLLGLGLGYSMFESESYKMSSNNKEAIVQPYLKAYVPLKKGLYFFGSLRVMLGNGRVKRFENIKVEGTPYSFSIFHSSTYLLTTMNINSGVMYLPAKKLVIEFSMDLFRYSKQFHHGSASYFPDASHIQFGLDTTTLNLGLKYLLTCQK